MTAGIIITLLLVRNGTTTERTVSHVESESKQSLLMRSCEQKRVSGINSDGEDTDRRITTMTAVNTTLFILVWTFTAVCQVNEDFNLSCENVTGSVGKQVNLTCKVSLLNDCCILIYTFRHPKDSTICKEEFPGSSCEQRNNTVTCSYTPTTAMTEQFTFFVQATCDAKTTEFTVTIADSLLRKAEDDVSKDAVSTDAVAKNPAIAAAVGFFSILLIIIIIITIICKTKPKLHQSLWTPVEDVSVHQT